MPPMFIGCQVVARTCLRCGRQLRMLAAGHGIWFACIHCDAREDGK